MIYMAKYMLQVLLETYMWTLPEMGPKISSKTYHFLPKFQNLPHLNYEFSYIFYIFLINLPEIKGKSPWCPFET